MSQVDKLRKAGCVRSDDLGDDLERRIESLTDEEVEALIAIKNKLKLNDSGEEFDRVF